MRILKVELPSNIQVDAIASFIKNRYGFNASDNEIIILKAINML